MIGQAMEMQMKVIILEAPFGKENMQTSNGMAAITSAMVFWRCVWLGRTVLTPISFLADLREGNRFIFHATSHNGIHDM